MSKKMLAGLLAVAVCFGLLQPVAVFATEETDGMNTTETTVTTENLNEGIATVVEEPTGEVGVADYQSFMDNLPTLEGYAAEYAGLRRIGAGVFQ